MAKKKAAFPTNVWEYINWLELTNRLTLEESNTLRLFVSEIEEDSLTAEYQDVFDNAG